MECAAAHRAEASDAAGADRDSIASVFAPPGHYYSPIPSQDDVTAVATRAGAVEPPRGIDLRESAQRALLEEFARFYPEMPFTRAPSPGLRYRFENQSYSYADGIFLYSMLRYLKPRRLIEVGSAFSVRAHSRHQ